MTVHGPLLTCCLAKLAVGSDRGDHNVKAEVYAFGNSTVRSLFSIYAMRRAAVFTLPVSTVGIDRLLSRDSHPAGGAQHPQGPS